MKYCRTSLVLKFTSPFRSPILQLRFHRVCHKVVIAIVVKARHGISTGVQEV